MGTGLRNFFSIGNVECLPSKSAAGQLSAMQDNGLLRADAPIGALASAMLAALQGGAVIDKATGSHRHLANALRQALALMRTYAG